jgi:hypothetical protein
MKKILCLAIAVFFLFSVVVAPAAEFWEKKEYKQWSQKECSKLLDKSPWTDNFTLTSVGIMQMGSQDRNASDAQQPYVKYQVQFRSAKPVRQAIVRQMQIAQKYDSMPADQQQAFDKNAESFLSADFSDAVVVYVTYETNNRVSDQDLARHWQTQTAEVLKNSVYISNSKGDKVYIAQFVPGQGAQRNFQFIFPRQVNGAPLLGPQDKSLKLEFAYPVIGGMGDGKAFMEFKVDKMIFEGNIVY